MHGRGLFPPDPFSCTVRPNSVIVITATSSVSDPRSVQKADMAPASSLALFAKDPLLVPWATCVSQPEDSAKAISSPTSAFINCAICFRLLPTGAFGYDAPFDGT